MGLSSAEFNYICQLTKHHAAIVLDAGKEYLVDSRLGMLADKEGYSSVHALIDHLSETSEPSLVKKVVDAMTINETFFFRDLQLFDYLRTDLFPQFKAGGQPLRIWSAACSTGQEPYTLAMILHQHFPTMFADPNTLLLASDISARSLEFARQGAYNQFQVNRGLPASYLVRYFSQQENRWLLKPEIKARVAFKEINLIGAWPQIPQLDMIFLRNVLIYFNDETKRQILAKVRKLLKPGGYLFLGCAETTLHLDPCFERKKSPNNANCYQLRL